MQSDISRPPISFYWLVVTCAFCIEFCAAATAAAATAAAAAAVSGDAGYRAPCTAGGMVSTGCSCH